jgi:hypothetical protein
VFLERLATEYNTELFDAALDPRPPGYPTRGRHLTRRWKEGRIFVPIPPQFPLDQEMLPRLLLSLCERLQLDPKDFGLVLH